MSTIHITRADPFDDEEIFTQWIAAAGEVVLEVHRCDGAGQYFLDGSPVDYDAAAAELGLERAPAFLRGL